MLNSTTTSQTNNKIMFHQRERSTRGISLTQQQLNSKQLKKIHFQRKLLGYYTNNRISVAVASPTPQHQDWGKKILCNNKIQDRTRQN